MFAFPFLTSFLVRKYGDRIANVATGVAWLILAGLILWLAYCWAWDRGRDHERAAWQTEVAKIRKERDDAMAQAGANDAAAAEAIDAGITEERKALDDATANIPDQPLSDRQRARACRQLMQQGRRCPAPAPGAGQP